MKRIMRKLKRREKKHLYLLGFLIFFSVLISVIPQNSVSWFNNSRSTYEYAHSAENWLADYKSGTYRHYGTHDYIAEKAWDLTANHPANGWLKIDNQRYANERIFSWYMLGTEVTDYSLDIEVIADAKCRGVYLSKRLLLLYGTHSCIFKGYGTLSTL